MHPARHHLDLERWRQVEPRPGRAGLRGRAPAGGRQRPVIGFVAWARTSTATTGIVWVSKYGRSWRAGAGDPSFGRAGIQVRMYVRDGRPERVVVARTLDAGVQYGEAAI